MLPYKAAAKSKKEGDYDTASESDDHMETRSRSAMIRSQQDVNNNADDEAIYVSDEEITARSKRDPQSPLAKVPTNSRPPSESHQTDDGLDDTHMATGSRSQDVVKLTEESHQAI